MGAVGFGPRLGRNRVATGPTFCARALQIPNKLRAALWNVAAAVPGVKLVGAVTDSAGRSGAAGERLDGSGTTQRYVLDPTDGRLLEATAADESAERQLRATYLEHNPAETAPGLLAAQIP